jgi:hypothetical protein
MTKKVDNSLKISAKESSICLLKIILTVTMEDNGKFFNYDGYEISW